MSDSIPVALARAVRRRARDQCEYCRLPQWTQDASFHVDHIVPRKNDGPTWLGNLAFACVTCSLKKGAREKSRDPLTGNLTPLFHPRNHKWSDHFEWTKTWKIKGLSPTGRATIAALAMNRPALIRLRRIWAQLGRFPVE